MAAAAIFPGAASAQARRPLAAIPAADGIAAAEVPVVDFHTHLQKRISAERLIELMDASGVTRVVLMPLYYGDTGGSVNDGEGSDEQAAEYARRHPGRFVPFVGMQRPDMNYGGFWAGNRDTARLLEQTAAKLASGEFFGMGEFMLRFYPYTNRFGISATSDMDYPPFSYAMRKFADLSAKYAAPMVVHAEAEPEVADGMRKLLEAHPEAIVVWSHNCGRSSAAAIRGMMARHSNLYADLGGMAYSGGPTQHYGIYWPRRTEWMHLVVDGHGNVERDMLALFNEYSTRFVIGTDVAHARVYERYGNHWPRWRYFLFQLEASTMHNIAYRNAERLFRPR